jgi:hypothetical protein
MTKIDYNNTVIYYCYYGDLLLYIGHTTDFIRRKNDHKNKCYNEKNEKYNRKFYKYIRENNIEFLNLRWEKENYPCGSKNEAEREEGLRIRNDKPLCNLIVAGRTDAEWREDVNYNEQRREDRKENPEKYKKWNKDYYENHKEEILQRQKEDRENNPERYRERNVKKYWTDPEKSREIKREYHNKNKDRLNTERKEDKKLNPEKYKQYSQTNYENHKKEILEKMKERITCDVCNIELRKSDFRRHERSKRHLENLDKKIAS